MTVCFLLYIEDTGSKSDGRVELFLNSDAARSAMEAAYAHTLRALRVDAEGPGEGHFCRCGKSFAIIADGEDCYSWSIGQRKFAGAADFLAVRKAL